ncbi:hypothetical protein [Salmonella enterica]|uniref:hypothetical protein n=1 Tax=Salmonella enterica TaxID=28901 RepID=UPI001F0627E0|nr:hypothetical protein [Salmonella enterica]
MTEEEKEKEKEKEKEEEEEEEEEEDDDDDDDDDGLAPMVDGLSGALCILILVSTVFIVSGTDAVVGVEGGKLTFRDSFVNIGDKTIYYVGGVSLSNNDLYKIREAIKSSRIKEKKLNYGVLYPNKLKIIPGKNI